MMRLRSLSGLWLTSVLSAAALAPPAAPLRLPMPSSIVTSRLYSPYSKLTPM